jgi:4-hydroxy-3-polyprenylbenzoate decarboxylase
MLAASAQGAAQFVRFVIVVDEDINPFNIDDVLWAMCTRVDPATDMNVITRTWSSALDPRKAPGAPNFGSAVIVDATRPWEWKEQFPPTVTFDEDYLRETKQKWARELGLA